MFLISLPGGTEWILIGVYLLYLIYSIVCILKYEQSTITRIVFILLAFFIPFFSAAYIVYALTVKRKKVAV